MQLGTRIARLSVSLRCCGRSGTLHEQRAQVRPMWDRESAARDVISEGARRDGLAAPSGQKADSRHDRRPIFSASSLHNRETTIFRAGTTIWSGNRWSARPRVNDFGLAAGRDSKIPRANRALGKRLQFMPIEETALASTDRRGRPAGMCPAAQDRTPIPPGRMTYIAHRADNHCARESKLLRLDQSPYIEVITPELKSPPAGCC